VILLLALASAAAPLLELDVAQTPIRSAARNFIRLPDGELWASGRSYPGGPKTVVGRLTLHGSHEPALTLPSGGDTSYDGMVWHEGLLWVNYYESHEGKTVIEQLVARMEADVSAMRARADYSGLP
jgi:hypothetical protein